MSNISVSELQSLLQMLCPLYLHVGLVVESANDGIYRCRVPVSPQNSNHINTIHAGIQWTVAEVLGGIVAIDVLGLEKAANIFVAVRSATIEFLRPARTDITAEAILGSQESEGIRLLVDAAKEAVFVLQTSIRSTSGELVAAFSAEYLIRPKRAI